MQEPTNSDIVRMNSDIMQMMGEIRQEVKDVADTGRIERGRIYEQAKLTNGRVNRLEKWMNDTKLEWKLRKEIKNEQRGEKAVIKSADNVNIQARLLGAKEKLFLALAFLATIIGLYVQSKGGF